MSNQVSQEDRSLQISSLVSSTEWKGAEVIPLAQDASVRKFSRLSKNGKTAILMDARPPLENTEMYQFMRNKLDKIGLHVPEIYATDHKNGFLIMEDFGDERCYELVVNKKVNADEMYSALVDALVHKCKADPKIALEDSVAYSDDYWLFRVEQFLLHYMTQVEKKEVSAASREDFLGYYKELINSAHDLDNVLLHGDYGVNNLYYLPQETGVRKVGMIDFQDMTDARGNMMGSPAFDLVFLLEDVRVDLPEDLEPRMIERFLKGTGIENVNAFNREYAIIALAQATKCLGLFARLGIVNGRKEYLQFIPYCIRNLNKHLPNDEFKNIRNWFEKNNVKL